MKAVVIVNGEKVEVEGKDLTVDSNMLTGEIRIVDRADDRCILSCYRRLGDYAYIVTGGDGE